MTPPLGFSPTERLAYLMALDDFLNKRTIYKPLDNSNESSEFVVPYYERYMNDASRIIKHINNPLIAEELRRKLNGES